MGQSDSLQNPHGQQKHLLEDIQSIIETELATSQITQTDPRAIQNIKYLFKCLESSITQSVKSTIFDQSEKNPTGNDGLEFYCNLTKFTTLTSTQLSILSLKKLLVFDPSVCNYNVSMINTKIQALFVLVRTRHWIIPEFEKLQHAIIVYERIKQPSKW